jgi:YNFM family putative membrane transporter
VNYIQKGTPQYRRAISALFLGTLASFGTMYATQPLIPVFSREFALNPPVASLAMSVTSAGLALSMSLIAVFAGFLDRKLTIPGRCDRPHGNPRPQRQFRRHPRLPCPAGPADRRLPRHRHGLCQRRIRPRDHRLVIGIYISGTTVGGLFSRLFVSTLTDHFSWHAALGAIGLIGGAITVWFWFSIPAPATSPARRNCAPYHRRPAAKPPRPPHPQTLPHRLRHHGRIHGALHLHQLPADGPALQLQPDGRRRHLLLYLVGTFSSTFMGGLADRHGNGKILCFSIAVMLAGAVVTLAASVVLKLLGVAIFTYGFFASHSAACSWVGKSAAGDKAQAASLYLLFYYCGASVVGTAGGVFLVALMLTGALILAARLLAATPQTAGQ